MKINKTLNKVLNIFLCILMIVTIASVNTRKTNAEDEEPSQVVTSEVSDNNTQETNNIEEENNIEENVDVNNVQVENIIENVDVNNVQVENIIENVGVDNKENSNEEVTLDSYLNNSYEPKEYDCFKKVNSLSEITEDVPILIVANYSTQTINRTFIYDGSKALNSDGGIWADTQYGFANYSSDNAYEIKEYSDSLSYDEYSKYSVMLFSNPYYTGELDLPEGISKSDVGPYLLMHTFDDENNRSFIAPNYSSNTQKNRKNKLYLYIAKGAYDGESKTYSTVDNGVATRVPYGLSIDISNLNGALITDNMNREDDGAFDECNNYSQHTPLADLRLNYNGGTPFFRFYSRSDAGDPQQTKITIYKACNSEECEHNWINIKEIISTKYNGQSIQQMCSICGEERIGHIDGSSLSVYETLNVPEEKKSDIIKFWENAQGVDSYRVLLNLPATFSSYYSDKEFTNHIKNSLTALGKRDFRNFIIVDENGFAYSLESPTSFYVKASLSSSSIPHHGIFYSIYDQDGNYVEQESFLQYNDNAFCFGGYEEDKYVEVDFGEIAEGFKNNENCGYYFKFDYLDGSVNIYYHDGDTNGSDYSNDLILVADYVDKRSDIEESTVVYRFVTQEEAEKLNTTKLYIFSWDKYKEFANVENSREEDENFIKLTPEELIEYGKDNGKTYTEDSFDPNYEYYISSGDDDNLKYIIKVKKAISCEDEDFKTTLSHDNNKTLLLPINGETNEPIIQVKKIPIKDIKTNCIYYFSQDDGETYGDVSYARLSDLVYLEDLGTNTCYTNVSGKVLNDNESFFMRKLLNSYSYYDVDLFGYDVTNYYNTYTSVFKKQVYPFTESYTPEGLDELASASTHSDLYAYEPYIQYKDEGESEYSTTSDLLSLLGEKTNHVDETCISPSYDTYTLTYGNGGDYGEAVEPVTFSYTVSGNEYGEHDYDKNGVCKVCGHIGEEHEDKYYLYTKEKMDSSFTFVDGNKYIFSGNYFDIKYHGDIISYTLEKNDGTGEKITLDKEEYDADGKDGEYHKNWTIISTKVSEVIDDLNYNIMCLNNDAYTAFTFNSDDIPGFNKDSLITKNEIKTKLVTASCPAFGNIYLPESYEFTCEEIETGKFIFKNADDEYLCADPTVKNDLYYGTREQAIANPITVVVTNGVAYVQIGETKLQQNVSYSKNSGEGTITANTNILRFYKSNQTNINVYSREASQSISTITYSGKNSLVYDIDIIDLNTWVNEKIGNIGNYIFNVQGGVVEDDNSTIFEEYVATSGSPIGVVIDCDESVDGIYDRNGNLVSEDTDIFVPENNTTTTYFIGETDNVTLLPGPNFNKKLRDLSDGKTISSILYVRNETVPSSGAIRLDDEETDFKVFAWVDGSTIKITSDAQIVFANKDASHMFEELINTEEQKSSLDVTWLNTSNVTDMSYMFCCTGQYSTSFSLDLSNFDTSNVTDMSHMLECVGVSSTSFSLDLSSFDTSNVTNMSYMLSCYGTRTSSFSLDLSNFDTSNVTDMSGMFFGVGEGSTSFSLDLSNFDTSNVTDMSWMFRGVGASSTSFFLDISSFDTSNVTDMSCMFECANMHTKSFSLDLSNFDTSNVTDMSSMFNSAGEYSTSFSLDLSNFDTSNVTDMSGMFGAVGLYSTSFSLDLSNFDTSNVTDMSYMFTDAGASSTSLFLDISNFDTSNVTNMDNMFVDTGTKSKKEDWIVIVPFKSGELINETKKLFGNSETIYASPSDDKEFTLVAILLTGKEFNTKLKSLVDASATYKTSDQTIASILFDNNCTVPTDRDVVNLSVDESIPVYAWLDDDGTTIKISSNSLKIYANEDSSFMFMGFNGAENKEFDIDLDWFNTSNVTDMSYMFSYVGYNVTTSFELDLSSFNTSNVTNMEYMFNNVAVEASALSLDLSSWDISKVTNMTDMFQNAGNDCEKNDWKVKIPFKTGNIANSKRYYYGNSKSVYANPDDDKEFMLTSFYSKTVLVDGKEFNTRLKKLVINSDATYENVDETVSSIVFTNESLPSDKEYVILSSDGYVPVYAWLEDDPIIVDASIIKITSNAEVIYANEDSSYMFSNFYGVDGEKLTLDVSWIDTSNITNMSYMFYYTGYLASSVKLDLTNFNTWNVTNMSYMFYNAGGSSSTEYFSIDLSSFDTFNAKNMSSMFYDGEYGAGMYCDKENWIVTIPYKTIELENKKDVLYGNYRKIGTRIRVNSYASPTNGKEFTLSITNLLSGKEINALLHQLSGHNIEVSAITEENMTHAKEDDTITSIIFDKGFKIPQDGRNIVTLSTDSSACPIYAWLDDDKETIKITSSASVIYANEDLSYMFMGFNGADNDTFMIDLSNIDTSNMLDMSCMFFYSGFNASSIDLHINNWDTSNVTNMHGVFDNLGKNVDSFLLDITNWNTSNVTDMSNMFNNAGADASTFKIDLSNFDASNVTDMTNMFTSSYDNCDLADWIVIIPSKTASLENTTTRFYGETSKVFISPKGNKKYTLPVADLLTGKEVYAYLHQLAGHDVTPDEVEANQYYEQLDSSITSILFDNNYVVPNDGRTIKILSTETSDLPVYAWLDNDKETIKITSEAKILRANEDSSCMFMGFNGHPDDNWEATIPFNFNVPTYLDTSNVIDMTYMFDNIGGYSSSVSLDLSNFDTSNVTDMSYMFFMAGYMSPSFYLDVSSFNTSNVTNMLGMFYLMGTQMSGEFTLDLKNFDTSKVTDMSYMFDSTATNAKAFELNLSSFDTSNVTNMSNMFSNSCSNIESSCLDLSNFDTSKVTNMSYMFENTAVEAKAFELNLSSFDTSNVTNMEGMFAGFGGHVTSFKLDLSNFDTSNVTNMGRMFHFAGMYSETVELDLSSFDTSNVTDMEAMFNLFAMSTTSFKLDLSNFDTSNVTNMFCMFGNVGQNSTSFKLDLSNFDTSNVTNMEGMFYNAGKNSTSFTLDLSSFEFSNVTEYSSILYRAGYSASSDPNNWFVYIPYATGTRTNQERYLYIGTSGNSVSPTKSSHNFSISGASLQTGVIVNSLLHSLAGHTIDSSKIPTSSTHKFEDSTITSILYDRNYVLPTDGRTIVTLSTALSKMPVYAWLDDEETIKITSEAKTIRLNSNSGYMFMGFNGKTNKKFKINLPDWDSHVVNNMNYMFAYAGYNASSIMIDLSNFNTSKVTSMENMFENVGYNCIDKDYECMFVDPLVDTCSATYWTVNIPEKTGELQNEETKFFGASESCYAVPYSYYEFTIINDEKYCLLEEGKVINAKLKSLVNPSATYNDSDTTITSIEYSYGVIPNGVDLTKVINLGYSGIPVYAWLDEDGETIKIRSTSHSVYANKDSSYMFSNFYGVDGEKLTIDASWIDTSNVSDMSYMFKGTGQNSSLSLLDTSTFNTSNVTDMSFMFKDSTTKYLDLSNFDTSKVEDMSYMFDGSTTKYLDLSSFDTSKVEDMSYMFNGCADLSAIIVNEDRWDITKVLNGQDLFDLFEEIDDSTWKNMFKDCAKIVGNSGTAYNKDKTGIEYAQIDGGKDNPGYLKDDSAKYIIGSKEYYVLDKALDDAVSYSVIELADDSYENTSYFEIAKNITLDLSGYSLTVNGMAVTNNKAIICDSSSNDSKGSLTYITDNGFVYSKSYVKTKASDPQRQIPVKTNNNTYEFYDVGVGYSAKKETSKYWNDGDQAIVGAYLDNDSIQYVLKDNGDVELGVRTIIDDVENRWVFKSETVKKYRDNMIDYLNGDSGTSIKPYFHITGISKDIGIIDINGFVNQKNLDFNYDGISKEVELVK